MPGAMPGLRTGAAFHSLRAVALRKLARSGAAAAGASIRRCPCTSTSPNNCARCKPASARPDAVPIELLLESGLLTHIGAWCTPPTRRPPNCRESRPSATVCVSISTEANLGDGFFDANRFLQAGGRLCIGSDSQATVCPAEELRWLEYQQRLRRKRRGVLATRTESHVGTRLWRDAAIHGAQALGQAGRRDRGRPARRLARARPAHPTMAGSKDSMRARSSGVCRRRAAIRDVMVAGRWVIKDLRHACGRSGAAAAFRASCDSWDAPDVAAHGQRRLDYTCLYRIIWRMLKPSLASNTIVSAAVFAGQAPHPRQHRLRQMGRLGARALRERDREILRRLAHDRESRAARIARRGRAGAHRRRRQFRRRPPARAHPLEIRGIADEIRARGHVHRAEVIVLERVRAVARSGRGLSSRRAANCIARRSCISRTTVPVQLEDRYVSPRLAPDYLEVDFTRTTPHDYLIKSRRCRRPSTCCAP
jgi:hypothetical protein